MELFEEINGNQNRPHFHSFKDLQEQGARYLKRSNNIPMAVLGYLTPKEKRAELELLQVA